MGHELDMATCMNETVIQSGSPDDTRGDGDCENDQRQAHSMTPQKYEYNNPLQSQNKPAPMMGKAERQWPNKIWTYIEDLGNLND